MGNFKLANRIEVREAVANIDALYGPYNSVLDACEHIPLSRRAIGLTVGIISNNTIEEYQWKSGILDQDLERKIEKINLTINYIGDSTLSLLEDEDVIILFSILGRNSIQKGFLYRVVNNIELYVSEITNLVKGNNSYTLPKISNSGIYEYRIKIIDSSGTFATNENEENYLLYQIRYGGVTAKYNFINLNKIKIKNIYTIAELSFTCNISTRDNSFEILGVYLTNGDDEIELIPLDLFNLESNSYIGLKYYYFPLSSELMDLNGSRCYLAIKYTENGILNLLETFLFTLLDTNSLELIPEVSSPLLYYESFPAYYYFTLLSGVENISVTLTLAEDSDFEFERITAGTYRNSSIKIIPKQIKNNAVLKINYLFYNNNQAITGQFIQTIGNIVSIPELNFYEPSIDSDITKDNIINASVQDYDIVENTLYIKLINDALIKEYSSSSFILDIYCKINKIEDKDIKYLSIFYGNEEVGYIKEEQINCRGIFTDTPLNEWVQIGLGYNLLESISRNGETAYYYAIYINGMVVKTVKIDNVGVKALQYNSEKNLTISLGNGILVQKCFIYYNNKGLNAIYPNTIDKSIIYNNYISHTNFTEPSELPILKLRRITDLTEVENYKNKIKIKNLTKFGTIGTTKYTDISAYENNPSLFALSVEIKKPALKNYAVLCRGLYIVNGIDLLEGIIIEVHTQGTSTLIYPVPNFRLTFWQINGTELEHYYPEFILKEVVDGLNVYYHEYVYTAKCDYMDSSHLNNTLTCNYYNNLILSLILDEKILGSPSASNGNLDAIMGFPIVMEISDTASDFNGIFTNIGSFMLNIDKTGESLGFDSNCISLEGTSNDDGSGASGRFIIPDELELKSYLNIDGTLNNSEIESDSLLVLEAIGNNGIYLEDEVNGTKVKNLDYVKWCKFLSEGLEYRYPDSDIYKVDNNKLTNVLNVDHFKIIYRMWSWVNNSDTYSDEKYREEFVNYFDLDYCMLYFIQLMIFAQTDNLGKNAMFDTWDGIHWYPRPYDLDSQAGLDNNGNDNIAPFVEIRPEFSINYDSNYTEEELTANYLNIDSKITVYDNQEFDRYHFSSNNSKLWINFYKHFKDDIRSFYNSLRTNYNYSAESIILLCEQQLINKLGINQYNQDFINKYLATSQQRLAYGNRWYKFKKWITLRFNFCDSYFENLDYAIYAITSAFFFDVKVDTPQYITWQYLDNKITKFVIDLASFEVGLTGAILSTLKVNLSSVVEAGLFKFVSYSQGELNYSGLVKLDVLGNKKINSISELVGSDLPVLKEITISNSSVRNINIPSSTKKLNAENVNLSELTFENNSLIEEINLKNSIINENINFESMVNLKKLDLSNCTFKGNITLSNLPNIDEFIINGASFEGDIIILNGVNLKEFSFSNLSVKSILFNGNEMNIETLNFYNTTFQQDTLNLNLVSKNLKNLYLTLSKNLLHLELTEDYKLKSLERLTLLNSSVQSLGSNRNYFDASLIDNISNVRIVSFNSDGEVSTTSYPTALFMNSKVINLLNFNFTGSGRYLFYGCKNLVSISGNITLLNSLDYTFWICSNLLNIPNNINIDTSVISAVGTFTACHKLGYSNISNIISNCINVTTFENACRSISFNDIEINLDTLFENNQASTLNLTGMFTPYNGGSSYYSSVDNKNITVKGKIKSNVISCASMFYSVLSSKGTISNLIIPYDIFENASSLTSTYRMFNGVKNIKFTGNNLPTYNNYTLVNVIDENFLPKNIENIQEMFYQTNIAILKNLESSQSLIFKHLSNLKNCIRTFGNASSKAFTYTSTNSDSISIDSIFVDNLFNINNNQVLNSISGCFINISNITCSSDFEVQGAQTISLNGLFGLTTFNDNTPITINLDKLLSNKNLSFDYIATYSGSSTYVGAFLGRKIYLESYNELDLLSLLKANNYRNLFKNAKILTNKNKLILSNVTNCEGMFYGCSVYDTSEQDINYINIDMPTGNCQSYLNMFRNSNMLENIPELKTSDVSNVSYMYSGCKFKFKLTLNPNYFNICRANLYDTSYMFENSNIDNLLYLEDVGLLLNCIKLKNVTGMFSQCHYLHGGVPKNIFGETLLNNITSLEKMFYETAVLFGVSDINKCIDENTFKPLINLTKISNIFSRNRINNSISGYSLSNFVNNTIPIIALNAFAYKVIDDITYAFNNSSYNVPLSFKGFKYANSTFLFSSITEISNPFVLTENIKLILDISSMFYIYNGRSVKTITNLLEFLEAIERNPAIKKSNVAGYVVGIDSSYTNDVSFSLNNEYYHGFNLTTS